MTVLTLLFEAENLILVACMRSSTFNYSPEVQNDLKVIAKAIVKVRSKVEREFNATKEKD